MAHSIWQYNFIPGTKPSVSLTKLPVLCCCLTDLAGRIPVLPNVTVARREAGAEPTGMYLRRVTVGNSGFLLWHKSQRIKARTIPWRIAVFQPI